MSAVKSGRSQTTSRPDRGHSERGVAWLEDGAKQLAPRELRVVNGRHCHLSNPFESQPQYSWLGSLGIELDAARGRIHRALKRSVESLTRAIEKKPRTQLFLELCTHPTELHDVYSYPCLLTKCLCCVLHRSSSPPNFPCSTAREVSLVPHNSELRTHSQLGHPRSTNHHKKGYSTVTSTHTFT